MKKLDLGQSLGLLANVGVIGGILLLAYELRQNNLHLEQQERYTLLQNVISWTELAGSDEEVARLIFRSPEGETLTADELDHYRRSELGGSVLKRWEWEFEQFEFAGNDAMTDAYRWFWRATQLDDVWEERKAGYSSDFVEFIDEEVAN